MDVYARIAEWCRQNPYLHSTRALASILLSMFGNQPVSLWEVFSVLDEERTALAMEAITRFSQEGESEELRAAAHTIMDLQENDAI